METEAYLHQLEHWPKAGRHILAQFDKEAIVAYQAYRPEIGLFAAREKYFGGAFSYSRMSWIKPNFLWMMYRSGWGTKPGQEVTLAVWLRRSFFDGWLRAAVPSGFDGSAFATREQWQNAVSESEVRLQWDPDHDPSGGKLERRALQLGLRGQALAAYGREAIIDIEDISDFVAAQREQVQQGRYGVLETPRERVYLPEGTTSPL